MEHNFRVGLPDGRRWVMDHQPGDMASYRKAKRIIRLFMSKAPAFVKAFVADKLMTEEKENS